MLLALMLLQSTSSATPQDGAYFDLAKLSPTAERCEPGATGEIVVCGRPRVTGTQRVDRLDEATPLLPRAEFGLVGKARMSVDAQRATVGGFTSNRAMVSIKVPF